MKCALITQVNTPTLNDKPDDTSAVLYRNTTVVDLRDFKDLDILQEFLRAAINAFEDWQENEDE